VSNDTTIWKDIPGYEGYYQINAVGDVKNMKGKILKPKTTRFGYKMVGLCGQRPRKFFAVHRLVMLTFVGKCQEGIQVNHINGIKTDNRLENLEYCTPSENILHFIRVLGDPNRAYGEKSGKAKLTNDKVREIRQLYATGQYWQLDLARQYSISRSALGAIVHYRTWRHIE